VRKHGAKQGPRNEKLITRIGNQKPIQALRIGGIEQSSTCMPQFIADIRQSCQPDVYYPMSRRSDRMPSSMLMWPVHSTGYTGNAEPAEAIFALRL
jgi:hypothetical protein